MDQPSVLRTARMGGFVKEDVLKYIDELNSKIYALEEERDSWKEKASAGGGMTDAQQQEYEAEVARLRGELGTTRNQLRAAQEELKNRPVIEGGEGGASSEELAQAQAQIAQLTEQATNATADLEAARAELQVAQEESADMQLQLTQMQAQLVQLQQDNDALRSDLAEAAAAALTGGQVDAAAAQQIAELQAKLETADAQMAALRAELDAKTATIEEQAGLSSEADLKKLAEYEALLSEQSSQLAEKDREIESLNQQVAELKENSSDSSFDMSALFMEAQMTAKKVAVEARSKAEKLTRDAQQQADQIVKDASDKAAQTVASANAQAQQTIENANAEAAATVAKANAEAEQKINDADAKAIKTVADAEESVRESVAEAERRNKTSTETARTVRALLRSEIDAVSKKFNEISLILDNLSSQAGSRLTEAKNVITEARSTVNDDDDVPTFDSFDDVAAKSSFGKADSHGKKEGGSGSGDFGSSFDELSEMAGDDDSWNS